jgi:S1-C subfamily serine protease
MGIEFTCSAGHKLRVADELAGKTVRCPKCSERIAVPRIGRNPIEASTSDVQLVEPPARSPAKSSRKVPPAESRASTGPAPSTHPSRSRDSGRHEPPPMPSKASASKRIWFLVAGFGAAALLLVTVGMFVALKFLAPKGAAQQSVAQNADAPGESPQKAGAASNQVAADKRDAAAPAKAAPAIANANGEKPDAEDPTPAAAPQGARSRETLPLPAPIQQLVVGGSGNYLVAALPGIKQVAIVDVAAKKISKLVPVEDSDPLLAAGETKFVVLERGQGILSRYDLKTGAREATESCESHAAIAMGSSSEGPIMAAGMTTEVIDLKTLKPTITKPNDNLRSASVSLLASADSKVFGACRLNTSPTGIFVFEVNGDDLQSTYLHTTQRAVIPSADGKTIFSGPMRYDLKCHPPPGQPRPNSSILLLPAATGQLYMSWTVPGYNGRRTTSRSRRGSAPAGSPPTRDPGLLTIQSASDNTPLVDVKDVVLPDFDQFVDHVHPKLPNERRLLWLPICDALVTVPASYDQLVIQHFNVKEELDNSGVDYFRIASTPPHLLERGKKLTYAIDVLSKSGKVQYALENGPPGAKVSPEGQLTWDVPNDFGPHDAVLLVKLTDGSGRELIHAVKLSDAEPTPLPTPVQAPPVVVERRAFQDPVRRLPIAPPPNGPIGSTVPNRFVGPVTAFPKSAGANVWHWTGGLAFPVRTEKGGFGGIVLSEKLYLLKDNGAMSGEPITLPSDYLHAGLRANSIVGVAINPTRVEICDRHGKLLRKIPLENVAPLDLALHPTKPICYVALDRSIPPMRGAFVVVDEQAGNVTSGDEDLGQNVVVDPSGRFLVSTYVHRVHVGDQIIVTPGRGAGRFPGRVPGRGAPPPHVGVLHTFSHIAVMVVYDLDSPLQPEFHAFTPLKSVPGPLRISSDGRRATAHALTDRIGVFSASNPLDFKAAATNYELTSSTGTSRGSDVAFHPTLPLSAVVGAGTVALFDADSGKLIPLKAKPDLGELDNSTIRRVLFSGDGKSLVILADGNAGRQTLLRVPASLPSDQLAALKKRATSQHKNLKSNAPPLAELTAWRGGLSKPATPAEIAAEFSDSVAIVRSGESTGTGFFVGTSGLVLTAAHCVSPMDSVQVIYHSQGKADEKNTADASVVYRDRKADLALLKIKVSRKLHPVVLADPIDVKSGEEVTIIANPGLGTEVLDNTVTTGIISNVKRMIAGLPYIQSSAAVNPGSSGGPMFDRSGHVIGVVVLKAGIEGVGFAVPPQAIAKFLLKATRHDTKQGLLERAWVDAQLKSEIPGGFLKIEKGSVTLQDKSGESKSRPLSDFSPGDQKLLALLATDD